MSARALRSVMVVDDDATNRKLLDTLLTADGYTVRCCASGAEALQAIADSRPDAVLLDLMMPGMDGFEVVRRLKADLATRTIPVLMITALDDEASRRRLAAAGVVRVLIKPVDRWQLKAALDALLDGQGDPHDRG